MDQQTTIKDKKSFLRNDPLLVCGMLVVYGVCILGLIAAAFWGLDRRSKQISANATSTAFAIATEQANVTATAVAHLAEQDQYELIDRFDDNSEDWSTGSINDEYMIGSTTINEGVYLWKISEIKQPFLHWENFHRGNKVEDFDIYVDSKVKVADGTPSNVCSGFVFRTASFDWEEGAYAFFVCNNSYFHVDYYKQGEWEAISAQVYSSAIQNYDWNRLEIGAQGNHFNFIINNEVVFEMTDDRQPTGGLALFIEVNEEKPVSIWFDNFGFQSR